MDFRNPGLGIYVGCKNEKEKKKWCIVSEDAEVVRKIFFVVKGGVGRIFLNSFN